MSPWHWILLTLATFRLVRFITTDDLTEPFREKIYARTGKDSNWSTLATCNWCVGVYIAAASFAFDHYIGIPDIILAAGAAMAVIGFIGNYDD